jgi:hypothetical protein
VCGKKGHRAGFVGSVYYDCPNRPCYLCKLVGHTTATCPYRIDPGHDCSSAPTSQSANTASVVRERELDGRCEGRVVHTAMPAATCVLRHSNEPPTWPSSQAHGVVLAQVGPRDSPGHRLGGTLRCTCMGEHAAGARAGVTDRQQLAARATWALQQLQRHQR